MATAPSSSVYDKPTTFGDVLMTGLVIVMSVIMIFLLIAAAAVVLFIAASVVFPP
jgi:hypothetical protein